MKPLTTLETALIEFLQADRIRTTLERVLIQHLSSRCDFNDAAHNLPNPQLNLFDEPTEREDQAVEDETDYSLARPRCAHGIEIPDGPYIYGLCDACDDSQIERIYNHRNTHCSHDVPLELICDTCTTLTCDPSHRVYFGIVSRDAIRAELAGIPVVIQRDTNPIALSWRDRSLEWRQKQIEYEAPRLRDLWAQYLSFSKSDDESSKAEKAFAIYQKAVGEVERLYGANFSQGAFRSWRE